MRIFRIRRMSSPGETGTLAHFDVDLGIGIVLIDMRLKRTPSGDIRCWPPKSHGRATARLTAELSEQISGAVVAALECETYDIKRAA